MHGSFPEVPHDNRMGVKCVTKLQKKQQLSKHNTGLADGVVIEALK